MLEHGSLFAVGMSVIDKRFEIQKSFMLAPDEPVRDNNEIVITVQEVDCRHLQIVQHEGSRPVRLVINTVSMHPIDICFGLVSFRNLDAFDLFLPMIDARRRRDYQVESDLDVSPFIQEAGVYCGRCLTKSNFVHAYANVFGWRPSCV